MKISSQKNNDSTLCLPFLLTQCMITCVIIPIIVVKLSRHGLTRIDTPVYSLYGSTSGELHRYICA
jgi:hypothetical protein